MCHTPISSDTIYLNMKRGTLRDPKDITKDVSLLGHGHETLCHNFEGY
jgi:predicted transport protein